MAIGTVYPEIITAEVVRQLLDAQGLAFYSSEDRGFAIPFSDHVVYLDSRNFDDGTIMWHINTRWSRCINMRYIAEAKNAVQEWHARTYMPKLIYSIDDDGFIRFHAIWTFAWEFGVTHEQASAALQSGIYLMGVVLEHLESYFPDRWKETDQ